MKLLFDKITVVDAPAEHEPTSYRPDLPDNPERILAIFDGGKFVKLIDFIGPGGDYMNDAYGVECYLQDEEVTDLDGLLVFEGVYRSWTDYWGEHDEELDGRWRRLTEEERECVKNDEYIWDPKDWYIFQEKTDTSVIVVYFINDYAEHVEKIPRYKVEAKIEGFKLACSMDDCVSRYEVSIWDRYSNKFENSLFLSEDEIRTGKERVQNFIKSEEIKRVKGEELESK